MNFSIPLKWKLYALVALGFALGILGIRAHWMQVAEDRIRRKEAERRVEDMVEAREIANEVEAMGDAALRERASDWVRERKDP